MPLYTPLGRIVTDDEMEDEERVVCPDCGFAILEDEMLACSVCEKYVCLYCWQENNGLCDACYSKGQ